MDSVVEQLAAARQELLDLGLRNPLLNFRPLRSRGLTLIAEQPAQVFDILVRQGRPMGFLSLAEASNQATPSDWLPQPDDPRLPPDHICDDYLQTPYTSLVLQERLLNTDLSARAAIDEQGINILYLALGLLHWREKVTDETTRLAPLLLIPVQLAREDAASPYRLHYAATDISENLSLRAKIAVDFDLAWPPFPEPEQLDVTQYLTTIAAALPPHWHLDKEAIHLGFFSFTRLTLYHDLHLSQWPTTPPENHPLLQTILNDPDLHTIPPDLHPHQTPDPILNHTVLDSDSSQAQAIDAVNREPVLVIQGPPGTGKSQTITNLIAEAVGAGKTVLFVAEKLAALDVVKRRLDAVGLGDAALEIHSHKTSRTLFLAELGRTLSLGEPKWRGEFPARPQWETARDRLNAYHQAINTPIGVSGLTPYQVIGKLAASKGPWAPGSEQIAPTNGELTRPPLRFPATLSAQHYTDLRAWVVTLQVHLQQMGVPDQHPFWGSDRADITPEQLEEWQTYTQEAIKALREWQTAAATLAHTLHLPLPDSPLQVQNLSHAATFLQQAPHLYAVQVTDSAWLHEAKRILDGLNAAATISHHHQKYDDWLIPEAWSQPVLPLRQALAAGQDRWGQWFSGDYRRGRALLTGLCQRPIPPEWADQMALTDAILEVQRLQPIFTAAEPLLAQLFTVRWQGLASDWLTLSQIGYWLTNLHQDIYEQRVPAAMLAYLQHTTPDKKRLADLLAHLHTSEATYQQSLQPVLHLLQPALAFPEFPTSSPPTANSFTTILNRLYTWHTTSKRWSEMARWHQLTRGREPLTGADALPIATIISVASTWTDGPTALLTWFEQSYYQALLEQAQTEQPALRDEDAAATQTTALAQFQTLDTAFLIANRHRLAYEHWQQLPRHAAIGPVGLLQKEMAKKRSQLPIRTLMQTCGRVIQRLKPVLMMSPLSVATFLPPEAMQFDIVIFDEASQIRPAEAYSAILRGRQAIIVGDSRQLPPTPFFERVLGENETEADENEDNEPTAPPESILDLLVRQNVPQAWLRWHYRSQHESLIALSNQEFYDNQLVIFPSPDAHKQNVGLVFHHLPHTIYERGASRTNPQEALAVAQKVIHQARTRPQQTLGVVAFSTAQQKAIWHQLEILRRQHPDIEPFFQAHPHEPFFVKNLENVQGDERDVILISLGYGRTAEGKLALNFGPLNQSGGERRLNVLITRARQRCELFANFRAEEMDLRRTDSTGVLALNKFLRHAATGVLPDLAPTEREEKDGLVAEIAAALHQQGHTVRSLNSGINLNLAIGDAANPGYDRLALMTDGGKALSAPSARDRERLQAQVLTRLGWQPYRLWSWGWWQFPQRQWTRLLQATKGGKSATITSEPSAINDTQLPTTSDPATAREEWAGIERYDQVRTEPQTRPIPPYIQAELKVSLTTDRDHWRYDKKLDLFTGEQFHLFDWEWRRFLPQRRTKVSGQLQQTRVKENPGPGQLYSALSYSPFDQAFYHSVWFWLFTPNNKLYQLLLDHKTFQFYLNTSHSHGERRQYTTTEYDPLTGELKRLRLTHTIDMETIMLPAKIHPAIATEVADEVKWVEKIVATEGPVHLDEVFRRLAHATGLTRRSTVVDGLVKSATAAAVVQNLIHRRGEFLWPPDLTHPPIRNRANLTGVSRSLDLVAPEEIEEAIQMVVQDGLGALPKEIPQAVGQLLGFTRLGHTQIQLVSSLVKQMLQEGRLVAQDKWIVVP